MKKTDKQTNKQTNKQRKKKFFVPIAGVFDLLAKRVRHTILPAELIPYTLPSILPKITIPLRVTVAPVTIAEVVVIFQFCIPEVLSTA